MNIFWEILCIKSNGIAIFMCFYCFMFLDVNSNYKSDNVDKRQFIDSILQDCGFNFGPGIGEKNEATLEYKKTVEM